MESTAPSPSLKSLMSGALSGAAAAWAMERFQNLIYGRIEAKLHPDRQQAGQPATVVAASRLYSAVLRRPLPQERERIAGEWAHYAMGAGMGAVYASVGDRLPGPRPIRGLLFGTMVFALADELMNSVLRFTRPPWEYPLRTHVYALASHWVYGLGLAAAA